MALKYPSVKQKIGCLYQGDVPGVISPFPDIPLVPTGGVTLDNIAELFQAGAAAVGVGTELISPDALARRDYAAIGALAKQFIAAVRKARG